MNREEDRARRAQNLRNAVAKLLREHADVITKHVTCKRRKLDARAHAAILAASDVDYFDTIVWIVDLQTAIGRAADRLTGTKVTGRSVRISVPSHPDQDYRDGRTLEGLAADLTCVVSDITMAPIPAS